MPKSLRTQHYQDLIASIKSIFAQGLVAAQKALEYHRLHTYWLVGRDMLQREEASGGALRLGKPLYIDISRELNTSFGMDISDDTVGRMVQFARNYSAFPEGSPLTFTHYMALQRLKDPAERERLEKKAIKNDMRVEDIKNAVYEINASRQLLQQPPYPVRKTLQCERGEPYIYRIYPDIDLQGSRFYRIDCGFKMDIDIPEGNDIAPTKTRVVRSVKENGKYVINCLHDGIEKLYTYAAKTLEVIDGDTIDVRIDVGFGMRLTDRLRLKGINCPELTQGKGKEAKRFLKDYLQKCPLIILRSTKDEMYGRWLADIFAIEGCSDPFRIASEGVYLNQLLIDKGLADLYKKKK
jgi:micrococcal nuclease